MQSCLLMIAVVLVGQVTGSSDRYSSGDVAPQNSLESSTQAGQAPRTAETSGVGSSRVGSSRVGPVNPVLEAKPLPNSEAKVPVSNPADLLRSLAKRSTSSQLSGVPLSLRDALAGASSRDEQSARVELYWTLATAVMEYDLALRELTEISALQQSILQPGQAWGEIRAVAKITLQTKQQAARALQYRLQSELGSAGENRLPLTSDQPLCGAYDTHYKELFGNRQVPEAAALDQLLEWEYAALRRLAGSVSTTRQWLDTISAKRSSQSDGMELLEAYRSFASSRRLFLQAVNHYNSHIARYTELATPERVGTQRLVAMLIKTDALEWNRDGIRRTSAEQPSASSNSSRQLPRTYADPSRKGARRIPTPESKGEHSILIE